MPEVHIDNEHHIDDKRYAAFELKVGDIVSNVCGFSEILKHPTNLRLVTEAGIIRLDDGTLAAEVTEEKPNYFKLPKGTVIKLVA
jgi:hypothetical protein